MAIARLNVKSISLPKNKNLVSVDYKISTDGTFIGADVIIEVLKDTVNLSGMEFDLDFNLYDVYYGKVILNLNANGTEAGQSKATIIVFDDAWNHGYGNTDPSKAYAAPTEVLHLEITLTNPVTLADFGVAPFNPFIIVNKERGREIHMADYPPTDLADLSYFGQYNDDSNVETGKYYKTVDNLPWVINFPSQFNYPIEKSSVDKAYLNFIPWVESGGSQYQDWFTNQTSNQNPDFIY